MVLVVDDNADNRALARAALEGDGFTVELAASGEAAIAGFAEIRPDCVLLDIRMPGMDGVTACTRLRALPGGADVPIVFVTAQRDLETFDRAGLAGGDDFLTKPYRPAELVARVNAAIKLRRMAAERTELYDLIRRQRDDLMRLQLQKEQLAAFVVHDLKNPVNAIELLGQRIERDPSASDRSRDAAGKIRSETHALLRMIMNLLDVSKADEGRLRPAKQPIDLGDLVRDVAADLRPLADASEVAIDVATAGLAIAADPDLARRIVENLVENAIRHAPEQSVVRVAAQRTAAAVELRVTDRGSGVPPEVRERMFDRFVQGNGAAARKSRGLGLAFCKLAIEAHGGAIWIEDAAPGAIFCARFPDE